jgi:hypothetical protein
MGLGHAPGVQVNGPAAVMVTEKDSERRDHRQKDEDPAPALKRTGKPSQK